MICVRLWREVSDFVQISRLAGCAGIAGRSVPRTAAVLAQEAETPRQSRDASLSTRDNVWNRVPQTVPYASEPGSATARMASPANRTGALVARAWPSITRIGFLVPATQEQVQEHR